MSPKERKCKDLLHAKIEYNINEFLAGKKIHTRGKRMTRIKSLQQAKAIAYSQVEKAFPECSLYLKRQM